jgi:hypothetical protein
MRRIPMRRIPMRRIPMRDLGGVAATARRGAGHGLGGGQAQPGPGDGLPRRERHDPRARPPAELLYRLRVTGARPDQLRGKGFLYPLWAGWRIGIR